MLQDVAHFILGSSVLVVSTQDKPGNNCTAGQTHVINQEWKHPSENKGTFLTEQSLFFLLILSEDLKITLK